MPRFVVAIALLIGVGGIAVAVVCALGWLGIEDPKPTAGERGLSHARVWPLTDPKPSAYVSLTDPLSEMTLVVGCAYVGENRYQSFFVLMYEQDPAFASGVEDAALTPIIMADLAAKVVQEAHEIESVGWSFSNGQVGREEWAAWFQNVVVSPKPSTFVANLRDSNEVKIKVSSRDQVMFQPRPLFNTPVQRIFDDCGGLE